MVDAICVAVEHFDPGPACSACHKCLYLAGAALVPIFCFGQSEAYHFWRLGPPLVPQWLVDKFVRTILFCPMLIYGVYGSPLPFRQTIPHHALAQILHQHLLNEQSSI